MIIDSNLERSTKWKPNTGPSIGGVAPSDFGTVLTPDAACGWRLFYVTGVSGQYCDWLAGLQRPWMANNGFMTLAYDIIVDVNSLTVAQAIETDTRISDSAGYNYNCSLQINYATGVLQISNASGAWASTPFTPGKYLPNIIHHVEIRYQFDTTKHISSVLSVAIDDSFYAIPLTMQDIVATKKGWTPGPLLQIQQDTNQSGGSFAMWMKGIEYRWE